MSLNSTGNPLNSCLVAPPSCSSLCLWGYRGLPGSLELPYPGRRGPDSSAPAVGSATAKAATSRSILRSLLQDPARLTGGLVPTPGGLRTSLCCCTTGGGAALAHQSSCLCGKRVAREIPAFCPRTQMGPPGLFPPRLSQDLPQPGPCSQLRTPKGFGARLHLPWAHTSRVPSP